MTERLNWTDWMTVDKKYIYPFLLLENSRPLSPWGLLDLSAYLGINSLTCPSPTPGVHPNPCPLSQWCYPTISSSVVPLSSFPQSFPALGSFQMSQLFASGGQSIGVSASASFLPMNTQDWSSLGWTGCISLQSKGLTSLLQHHGSKTSILRRSAVFTVQLSHPYMATPFFALTSLHRQFIWIIHT